VTGHLYDETSLRDLVDDVVQTIKRNLKVDWTEPHRDQVRAEIRNRLAETVMTEGHEHEAMVLDVLKRAVAEALERKRRLGQYAVIWREGNVVCTGPDAPVVPGVPSTGKKNS